MRSDGPTYDWAQEFDDKITAFIDRSEDEAVADFRSLGDLAKQAHPTWDHFLPLIYALAQRRATDTVRYFNAGFDLASVSMRSMLLA
jgi:4,5-DOPA dioxygenase extradiol